MNIVDPIRDKDDIQAMKEYLREWNERNYLLFLFGINSGLRVGDILRIRVKDVQGWYIKIKEQKTGKRKQLKMTPCLILIYSYQLDTTSKMLISFISYLLFIYFTGFFVPVRIRQNIRYV